LLLAVPVLAAEGGVRGTVKLFQVLPDGSKKALPDASEAVVYVPDFEQPAPEDSVGGQIHQKDKRYVPSALPIVKGQTVEFVNDDPILHDVFSSSRAAGRNGMDLGKYKGPGKTKTWQFRKAGIIDIYCDIHEAMFATVLVLPNSAFQKPTPAGAFQIDHLPAGHHVLYVWARNGKKASADVDVQDGKVTSLPPLEVDITVGESSHMDVHGKPYSRHPEAYGD